MKKQWIFILIFIALGVFGSYFLTTHTFNEYIIPFKRSFKNELTSLIGNVAVLSFAVLLVFSFIKKPFKRIMTLGIISIALMIIVFALRVYSRYYSSFFSFRTLTVFKNPAANLGLSVVGQSAKEFFSSFSFLLVIPGIVFIVYSIVLRKKEDMQAKTTFIKVKPKVALGLIAIIFSFFMILNFQSQAKKQWKFNSDLPMYGAQTAGVYNYYVYELLGFNFNYDLKKIYNQDQVTVNIKEFNKNDSEYVNFLDSTNSNSKVGVGAFNGKNLCILQLESLNTFALDISINGQEVMPNLKKFINNENTYYMENFYTSVGQGKTADAELSVMTGVNPNGSSTLHWDYKDGNYVYSSLPKMFKEKYSALAYSFHGDVEGFYNRETVHEEMFGFDEYYSLEDYVLNHPTEQEKEENYINGWVDDEKVIEWMEEIQKGIDGTYFTYAIMTVSHTPFIGNPKEDEYNFGLDSTLTNRYLAFMRYVDDYLGRLFERIENDTDTIYVIYGDHGCGLYSEDLDELFPEKTALEQTELLLRVPGLIYDASGTLRSLVDGDMKQELVRSEIDLFTTLVDLFDLDYRAVRLGVNVLSNEKTFCYDPNTFTIITDEYIYYPKNGDYYFKVEIKKATMLAQVEIIKKYKLIVECANEYNMFKN